MRAHPRYPTTTPCWLELRDGRRLDGWVEDISEGGVGIRVSQDVAASKDFTLVIPRGDAPLRLDCEVRHSRDLWQTRFLHARFAGLTPLQQQAVDDLLRSAAEAGQPQHTSLTSAMPFRRLLGWRARRG